MNNLHRLIRKAPLALALVVSLLSLVPTAANAAHPDIAHFATQLNLATSQLAYELRGAGAYSVIRQRADRLSREAADLVNVVRRNQSNNRVESQFRDVQQRFASFEQAFLRLNRRDYDPYLFNELDRISHIYSNLSGQFHYQSGYAYVQPLVVAPPVVIRQYNYDSRRGNVSGYSNRSVFPPHKEQSGKRDRREYDRRVVRQAPNYDHRSPVLERQQRLDNRRHSVNTGRRGNNTETSRRNHYE